MSDDEEARPANVVTPRSAAADGARTSVPPIDRGGGRVPPEIRRTWWFRSLIAFFTLVVLTGFGIAIRFALRHQWLAFGIMLTIAVCFAVIVSQRAAGYGWDDDKPARGGGDSAVSCARDASDQPDGGRASGVGEEELVPVPEEVRRTRWWRGVLWIWLGGAILLAVEAILTGLRHDWVALGFGLVGVAFCCIRLLFAWMGYEPPEFQP